MQKKILAILTAVKFVKKGKLVEIAALIRIILAENHLAALVTGKIFYLKGIYFLQASK